MRNDPTHWTIGYLTLTKWQNLENAPRFGGGGERLTARFFSNQRVAVRWTWYTENETHSNWNIKLQREIELCQEFKELRALACDLSSTIFPFLVQFHSFMKSLHRFNKTSPKQNFQTRFLIWFILQMLQSKFSLFILKVYIFDSFQFWYEFESVFV